MLLPDKSYDFLVPGHDRQLLAGLLALAGAAMAWAARAAGEAATVSDLTDRVAALAASADDPVAIRDTIEAGAELLAWRPWDPGPRIRLAP